MGKIGIVTDSTADLPVEYYKDNDVVMVPLVVRFGEELFKDWIDIKPDKFYSRLKSVEVLPKTSQPSAGDFIEAYKSLSETCDQIISIHISSKLSGTVQSAQAAKQELKDVPITLIDSEQASIMLGAIVMKLVKAREEGATKDDLVALAESYKKKGKIFFVVDTLKYLELGGRIGKASALLGSMVLIKPILVLEDGEVTFRTKVKGTKKARRELVSLVKGYVDEHLKDDVFLIIGTTDNPELAEGLKSQIDDEGITYDDYITGTVGSVIGTYTGPGAYAVAVL